MKNLSKENDFITRTTRVFFQTEWNRISAAKKLIKEVSAFRPDVIYLRWGMYVYPVQKIFKIAPTIVEINTNDYKEHKLLGATLNLYNQLTRSIFLSAASGLIFTSQELSQDPVFTKFNKPFTVITNGIFWYFATLIPFGMTSIFTG